MTKIKPVGPAELKISLIFADEFVMITVFSAHSAVLAALHDLKLLCCTDAYCNIQRTYETKG